MRDSYSISDRPRLSHLVTIMDWASRGAGVAAIEHDGHVLLRRSLLEAFARFGGRRSSPTKAAS